MTPETLRDFAINYYCNYSEENEQIRTLLEIKLSQLCKSYSLTHHLPKESLTVKTRIKTLDSFLNKLKKKGWPAFTHPASVINDFIGARITCWFVDDCAGILDYIIQYSDIEIIPNSVENYIANPKASGYRALHVLANINYPNLKGSEIIPAKVICEIQIRTRLQDAWGDITHDLYYRAKHSKQPDKMNYSFLNDIAKRLLQQDHDLLKLKDVYTQMATEQQP